MNTLHIYFVLDRSGSMESIRTDVIGGFNTFVHAQKALPDAAILTLAQFDSQDVHEVTIKAEDIQTVTDLGVSDFIPRGGTPLYDAIGHAITEVQMREEARTEANLPSEDVLMVIFTDGGENQSRQYTQEKAFDLIKKKEGEGWTFVYMGANQDSYETGASIGVYAGSTSNFAASAVGTQTAYASLSDNMTQYRTARTKGATPKEFFDTKAAEEVE